MNASLWLRETPALPGDALPARADVAIVGGGVAGICAALHLARLGCAPVVVEADRVAGRASGRNDGQLLLGLGEHYHRIVGQFGRASARALWAFIRTNNEALKAAIAELGIACDLVDAGGLRLAETPHEADELGAAADLLAQDGVPHALLTPQDLAAAFPAARGFHGALRLPGEAVVQPVRMVHGLAAAAQAAGARIAAGACVAAIDGTAGEFAVRLADGRTLRAAVVAHCTSALARELDGSGFLQRHVFPFRGQVLATEPLPPDLAAAFPRAAMSSNFCYEYFRMHGGRFVVGGMRWSVRGEESGIVDDTTHNPEVGTNLLGYVHRHFPSLCDVAFPHVWTGIMAGTPDGLPLCGELPGRPGEFALLAFNGYGLSFAFAAGACLAQQIVRGAADDPAAALFAPRRFHGGA